MRNKEIEPAAVANAMSVLEEAAQQARQHKDQIINIGLSYIELGVLDAQGVANAIGTSRANWYRRVSLYMDGE